MITTTLKNIKSHKPCQPGWLQLLKGLDKKRADNKPLRLETILEINGLEDAIWGLRAVDVKYEPAIRLYNCWQAKQVLHVFEQAYPNDSRVKIVIETSERFAWGRATFEELVGAARDAWDVWDAAESSARDAAGAAARDAAGDATRDAAGTAAGTSAGTARIAAWDAWAAARDAAEAAWAAARDAAGTAAGTSAGTARIAAWDAWAAARDAAEAAWAAARDAAGAAAGAAAGTAAGTSAGTARIAAWDAWAAARDAAWDVGAAREEFIRLVRLEGVYGEIMEKAHANAI